MDEAPAIIAIVNLGLIPGGVKPKTKKMVYAASLLDVQQKRNSVKPPSCVVDSWADVA